MNEVVEEFVEVNKKLYESLGLDYPGYTFSDFSNVYWYMEDNKEIHVAKSKKDLKEGVNCLTFEHEGLYEKDNEIIGLIMRSDLKIIMLLDNAIQITKEEFNLC